MKAITLWQPWASLLACGAKKYETRSWATNYRGPIAIHTAKKPFDSRLFLDRELYPFAEALTLPDIYSFESLPYGCIIATAELVGCYRIYDTVDNGVHIVKCPNDKYEFTKVEYITSKEKCFGDWREGRFAWEFANMTMLPVPIPAKGKQGLWNWDMITVKKHGAMGRSELSALDFTADEDMCVICGSYVPEGRMVCVQCEKDPQHALRKEDNNVCD